MDMDESNWCLRCSRQVNDLGQAYCSDECKRMDTPSTSTCPSSLSLSGNHFIQHSIASVPSSPKAPEHSILRWRDQIPYGARPDQPPSFARPAIMRNTTKHSSGTLLNYAVSRLPRPSPPMDAPSSSTAPLFRSDDPFSVSPQSAASDSTLSTPSSSIARHASPYSHSKASPSFASFADSVQLSRSNTVRQTAHSKVLLHGPTLTSRACAVATKTYISDEDLSAVTHSATRLHIHQYPSSPARGRRVAKSP